MSLMDRIKAKAKADKKRIVLPEGAEERTVEAAAILLKEGICDVILLGDEEKIAAYGEDYTEEYDQYTYTRGDSQLVVLIEDGYISSIEYQAVLPENG